MQSTQAAMLVVTGPGCAERALRTLAPAADQQLQLRAVELAAASAADLAGVCAVVVAHCMLDADACARLAWLLRSAEAPPAVAVECRVLPGAAPATLSVVSHVVAGTAEEYAAAAHVLGPARVTLLRSGGDMLTGPPVVCVLLPFGDAGSAAQATLLEDGTLAESIERDAGRKVELLVLGAAQAAAAGGRKARNATRVTVLPGWQHELADEPAQQQVVQCADGAVCIAGQGHALATRLRVPTLAIGAGAPIGAQLRLVLNCQASEGAPQPLAAAERVRALLAQAGGLGGLAAQLAGRAARGAVVLDPRGRPLVEGLHRSGWQFALSGLRGMQLPLHTPLLLDTYLDRTLLPGSAPYTQPWAGFVHHPYDCPAVGDDAKRMLEGDAFCDSLPHCRALFALSADLGAKVRAHLKRAAGAATPPVFVVPHPTQLEGFPRFSAREWRAQAAAGASRVVQVGAWLRVPGAIEALPTKRHRRCLLCAPGKPGDMCRSGAAAAAAATEPGGVEVVDTLTEAEYDELLSRSVVFLRLHDASACNTVLECAARGTPVIVNKLPALEEVLGTGYPGFYTDSGVGSAWAERAAALVDSDDTVARISRYLGGLDKRKLALEAFVASVRGALLKAANGR